MHFLNDLRCSISFSSFPTAKNCYWTGAVLKPRKYCIFYQQGHWLLSIEDIIKSPLDMGLGWKMGKYSSIFFPPHLKYCTKRKRTLFPSLLWEIKSVKDSEVVSGCIALRSKHLFYRRITISADWAGSQH